MSSSSAAASSVPAPSGSGQRFDLRPILVGVAVAASVGVLVQPRLVLVWVGVGAVVIGLFTRPTTLFMAGVALTMFAGFWARLGVPLPLHRVLLLVAIIALLTGLPIGSARAFRIRWRPEHLLICLTTLWVLHSAVVTGTLRSASGQAGLFDRLGIIPYLLFALAPLIVDSESKRRLVLRVLTIAGVYLALMAFLEGTGLKHLAWPSYINDPTVGISFERARGPFVDSSANGLALFASAVSSALLARRSRGIERFASVSVGLACLLATVLTLTRSVWLGVGAAVLVTMAAHRKLRKFVVPAVIGGVLLVGIMFQVVGGLRESVDERASSNRSVWDRQNLNSAALAVVEDKPLTGVGWANFVNVAPEYLWMARDYPLSGQGIDIHNFALRLMAEVGVPGFILWIATFVMAMFGAVARRGPPELDDWRWGLLAMVIMWFVVALLTPGEFSYPTFVLWMWAGITAAPYLRTRQRVRRTSAVLRTVVPSDRKNVIHG